MFTDYTTSWDRISRPIPKYRDVIRAILGISIAVMCLVYTVSIIESQVVKSAQYKNFIKYGDVNGFQPIHNERN